MDVRRPASVKGAVRRSALAMNAEPTSDIRRLVAGRGSDHATALT